LTSLDSVRANPAQAQLVEMNAALESAGRLADLMPVMLINRTVRPFIFGDAPVALYNGYYRDVRHRGVLGFDTPGLMVFLPLSANPGSDAGRQLLLRCEAGPGQSNPGAGTSRCGGIEQAADSRCIFLSLFSRFPACRLRVRAMSTEASHTGAARGNRHRSAWCRDRYRKRNGRHRARIPASVAVLPSAEFPEASGYRR